MFEPDVREVLNLYNPPTRLRRPTPSPLRGISTRELNNSSATASSRRIGKWLAGLIRSKSGANSSPSM